MIRVTAEVSTEFARYLIQEVDEKNKKLNFIAQGLLIRDLEKIGINRSDVSSLRITESRDFSKPTAKEVRAVIKLWDKRSSYHIASRTSAGVTIYRTYSGTWIADKSERAIFNYGQALEEIISAKAQDPSGFKHLPKIVPEV